MRGFAKISDYQQEGPGFNPRPGRVLNIGRPSLATPSVDRDDRDAKPAIDPVSQRSIEGPKITHTLANKSRPMPVLWTVSRAFLARALDSGIWTTFPHVNDQV